MNISIVSDSSAYHQLASKLSERKSTDKIFHFGASKSIRGKENYFPCHYQLPKNGIEKADINQVLTKIIQKDTNLVLCSGLAIPSYDRVHSCLRENNIPYFFVDKKLTSLEKSKSLSKKLLNFLQIPTPQGFDSDGNFLYNNWKSIPRPFVIKLNETFQFGRQTSIVSENNQQEIYIDLFSHLISGEKRITNISLDTTLIVENFVEIVKEYSYHCLVNKVNWQYFGSARDYKKAYDEDRGFNTIGMGAYNLDDIDPRVHDYTDKIFHYLKEKNFNYKGFLYLGIAIDKNNQPMVLEINTRSGDPELNCIIDTIDNDLSEVFFLAATNEKIPEIRFNKNKIVTVRIINSENWLEIPTDLPLIKDVPNDIFYGLDSEDNFRVKHSHLTAQGVTHREASEKIYKFLDSQYLGQFYYRKDIGIIQ